MTDYRPNFMKIKGQLVTYTGEFYTIPVIIVDQQGLASKVDEVVHVHDGRLCFATDCVPIDIVPCGELYAWGDLSQYCERSYNLKAGSVYDILVSGPFLDKLAEMLKFKLPEPAAV